MTTPTVLLTGGAGFIGSELVHQLLAETEARVVNVDALTYAANPLSLEDVKDHPRYVFEQVDVNDRAGVDRLFATYAPDTVYHLAAESHVDRSIDAPLVFVETNVVGTANMLHAARTHFDTLPADAKERFRFIHISTDEVFGSLGPEGKFSETTAYDPSSPYSASKAASDHLVRAWARTFELPVVVSNCSNNYGPRQFPEKLIPLMTLKGLEGGALTNGVMRDLGDLPEGFGVIAGSIGPSHAFVDVTEIGTTARIFGMDVADGDLVHADRHGALVIPPEVIPNLHEAIEKLLTTERLVLDPARREDFDFAAFEAAWSAFEKART